MCVHYLPPIASCVTARRRLRGGLPVDTAAVLALYSSTRESGDIYPQKKKPKSGDDLFTSPTTTADTKCAPNQILGGERNGEGRSEMENIVDFSAAMDRVVTELDALLSTPPRLTNNNNDNDNNNNDNDNNNNNNNNNNKYKPTPAHTHSTKRTEHTPSQRFDFSRSPNPLDPILDPATSHLIPGNVAEELSEAETSRQNIHSFSLDQPHCEVGEGGSYDYHRVWRGLSALATRR